MSHTNKSVLLAHPRLLAVAICGVMQGAVLPAHAQLEEVVVTATKRAESLQDVPISMLSLSGEAIKEQSIRRMEDFTMNMPAVTVAQTPIANSVFIRGVGTAGSNQGMEQSVSIFHDGIYMGRHQLSRAPFMDLARVEVLRGPQSILFGKNTIGGALSVHSAKPTSEFEAEVSGLIGEDGEQEINAVISGPLGDRISGRLAYRGYEMDGYLKNTLTGDDSPEREDWTLRGQLTFDVTDTLTANVKWERSEFKQKGVHTQIYRIDPLNDAAAQTSALNTLLAGGLESFDEKRAVDNDGGARLGSLIPSFAGLPGFPDKQEGSDNKMDVAHLNLEWALGEHTLTSITGYAHYEYVDICDCDFAALPLIQVDASEDYDQYSQEIRLTSPVGEKFDYIAGLYWQKSELDYRSGESFGTNLLSPAIGNVTRDYALDQESEMWAAFGSITFNFTDRTRGTAGLRYASETKEADHPLTKRFTDGWTYPTGVYGNTPEEYDRFEAENAVLATIYDNRVWVGALGTFEHDIRGADREEEHVSWSLNLEHDLSDEVLLYGTMATGFKGGGFDGRFLKQTDSPDFEYDEEEAMTYELGAKMTLLDGMMTLNTAVFFTEVDDYQVSIFDGATGFQVTNAAKVESKGVEADLRWAATDNLTIGAALSYLKAEYAKFPNAPCSAKETQEAEDAAGGVPNSCTNPFDPLSAGKDVSGEPNLYSPEWAGNLNADYRIPVADNMEFRAIANLNYSDDFFTVADLDPITVQKSFYKVDLRLSLGSQDGTWEVAVIGKNLNDKLTSSQINDQPLVRGNYFAQTDRPRSYALQATYRF